MTFSQFPVNEILSFWFADVTQTADHLSFRMQVWFAGGSDLDKQITEKFGHLFLSDELFISENYSSPREVLAAVILFDQFSRNCFRGKEEAFAYDRVALKLMDHAIEKQWDKDLHVIERSFLYMPLQHSEVLARQEQGVRLFNQIADEAEGGYAPVIKANADYAQEHMDLIVQFGRFPHRNKVLGRSATEAEVAYLDGGGKTFGQ